MTQIEGRVHIKFIVSSVTNALSCRSGGENMTYVWQRKYSWKVHGGSLLHSSLGYKKSWMKQRTQYGVPTVIRDIDESSFRDQSMLLDTVLSVKYIMQPGRWVTCIASELHVKCMQFYILKVAIESTLPPLFTRLHDMGRSESSLWKQYKVHLPYQL